MERLNFRRRIAPAMALSLAALSFAACGSDSVSEDKDTEPQTEKVIEGAGITHEYYEDGSRITSYEYGSLTEVLAYCDGKYIVERANHYDGGYDGSGNDIERTLAPEECADGKLTPEDFQIPG